MEAFDWIGQLFQWIGSFFPRVHIVRSTHKGVKFRFGKKVKKINPGICIYWPLVTEIDIWPVARQTHNLAPQCAVTKDKVEITITVVVVYKIVNIIKSLTKNWDFNDTITDIAATAVPPVIMQHTYDDLILQIADETIQHQLTQAIRAKLLRFGVKVSHVGITDFSKCLVIKNVTGHSEHTLMFPHHAS